METEKQSSETYLDSGSNLNKSSGSMGPAGSRRGRADRRKRVASKQGGESSSQLNKMDKATEEKLSDLRKSTTITTR